jgi:hypothetical protein
MKKHLLPLSVISLSGWFFLFPFQKIWHDGMEGRLNFTGLALIAASILISTLLRGE